MKRRFMVAIGTSALLMLSVLPGTASAAHPPATRFGRVDTHGVTASSALLLSRQDPNRMVMAFVELIDSPIATQDAAAIASGTKLTESQKGALRKPLIAAQNALTTRLGTMGATVQGSFTDVLNAVRIRVPALQLPKIAAIPGVKRVSLAAEYHRDNTNTVPYIGADTTWGQTGFTGAGVTIAIIDTGINYYHKDFGGGPGWAADTGLDRSDGHFPTAKVTGGYDFAGDNYDPDSLDPAAYTPAPDNDPLDCKAADAGDVQHGTHVAGTAAGEGVNADGSTYTGPYNAAAEASNSWRIGPGTAPQASLHAYRVFGCGGSTFLVVDAIERAVRDGVDVINMSLGSDFGNPDSADSEAVNNASLAGVTVVMSAGNNGSSAYTVGSPGVATRGIAVAAMDAEASFPGATIHLATQGDVNAINANDSSGLPVSGTINRFADDPSTVGDLTTGEGFENFGCFPADYTYNGFVAGQIPVVDRGICARIQRAQEGQAEGAAAVVMINSGGGFPPFENTIPGVTIPFLGVDIADAAKFDTDNGTSASATSAGDVANPTYQYTASFSSAGPRRGDTAIKPDVSAPGVSVFSADGSTTNQGKSLSGTSMASPATAGVVALITQAHPTWTPEAIKAALIGTATPAQVLPYDSRINGAGEVTPRKAVDTKTYVVSDPGTSSISFGDVQLDRGVAGPNSYSETRSLKIVNTSGAAITYDLSNSFSNADMGFAVAFSSSSVTVAAGSSKRVNVTLSLSEADVAALPDVSPFHGPLLDVNAGGLYSPLTNVAGAVTVHPETAGAGQYDLQVPWLIAPRGLSNVSPKQKTANVPVAGGWKSSVVIKNKGLHQGIADTYAWGLLDDNDHLGEIDLRAAGVQSVNPLVCAPGTAPSDACLIFAVSTFNKWNNPSPNEFDVYIDTNNDGDPDFLVAGVDASVVLGTGNFAGIYVSAVVDLSSGSIVDLFFATAPNNGSTLLLPVLASDLGLTSTGRFDYMIESFDDAGNFDVMTTSTTVTPATGWARFFAFAEPVSNGDFVLLAPGDHINLPLGLKAAHWQPRHGMQGWMVVTMEDATGGTLGAQTQADLIPIGKTP